MNIGGLTKFSAIDYPGKLCCIVFFQGCPLRCAYCHNEHLQDVCSGAIAFSEVIDFLKTRIKRLEAVVLSGGEPLMQDDLSDAVENIKSLGFLVGLHTSGFYTDRFEQVLPKVDWVGFDVKHLFEKYEDITGNPLAGKRALDSLKLLIKSNVPFEARLTYDSRFISESNLVEIAKTLAGLGINELVIQQCVLRQPKEVKLQIPNENTLGLMRQHLNVKVRY